MVETQEMAGVVCPLEPAVAPEPLIERLVVCAPALPVYSLAECREVS